MSRQLSDDFLSPTKLSKRREVQPNPSLPTSLYGNSSALGSTSQAKKIVLLDNVTDTTWNNLVKNVGLGSERLLLLVTDPDEQSTLQSRLMKNDPSAVQEVGQLQQVLRRAQNFTKGNVEEKKQDLMQAHLEDQVTEAGTNLMEELRLLTDAQSNYEKGQQTTAYGLEAVLKGVDWSVDNGRKIAKFLHIHSLDDVGNLGEAMLDKLLSLMCERGFYTQYFYVDVLEPLFRNGTLHPTFCCDRILISQSYTFESKKNLVGLYLQVPFSENQKGFHFKPVDKKKAAVSSVWEFPPGVVPPVGTIIGSVDGHRRIQLENGLVPYPDPSMAGGQPHFPAFGGTGTMSAARTAPGSSGMASLPFNGGSGFSVPGTTSTMSSPGISMSASSTTAARVDDTSAASTMPSATVKLETVVEETSNPGVEKNFWGEPQQTTWGFPPRNAGASNGVGMTSTTNTGDVSVGDNIFAGSGATGAAFRSSTKRRTAEAASDDDETTQVFRTKSNKRMRSSS